jgi:hypothetical protein
MTAYQNITGSGYLNNPVRTVIIDRDNRPGSYPTHVSPIDLRRPESADLIRPFRDDLTIATPQARATARVVFDRLPTPGSTLTLTGLSNPVGPATVSSVFEFQALDVPATTPGAYTVSLAGVISTARDPGLPGLTPKQLTRRRAAERLIEAINAATGSLITARPGPIPGEVLLEQRVPGSAGNLSNSTTAVGLTVTPFAGAGDGTVRYPFGVGVVDGDPTLVSNEPIRRVVRGVRSGTLDVPTSGRASLLDAPSDGHPYVAHSPFDETGAQVAFGINTGGSALYGTQARLDDPFITRGSVSGSLDEPLGAKDKIEIDLTPAISTTLRLSLAPGGGNPGESPLKNASMAFYNFEKKEWESLGDGRTDFTLDFDLFQSLNSTFIGFSTATSCSFGYPSSNYLTAQDVYDESLQSTFTGNKLVPKTMGWSSPIDTYGFPLHPKYHATSSQTLEVSSIVDRPFLVEKIVYEFSCSSPEPTKISGSYATDDLTYHTGGGTFFILNQRQANIVDLGLSYPEFYLADFFGSTYYPPLKLESDSRRQLYGMYNDSTFGNPVGTGGSIPQTRTQYPGSFSNPLYINTTRDLVTFARVGAVNQSYNLDITSNLEEGFPHPAKFMDLAIPVPDSGSISGKFTLCQDIVGPSSNPSLGTTTIVWNQASTLYTMRSTSTRNGLDVPTGRAYKNEFIGPKILYSLLGNSIPSSKEYVYGTEGDALPSPYVIMPGDNLVFGWQCHISQNINSFFNSDFTLGAGAGKLTLYGSYLQDDKPVHDIYKDQLNSDAAHETIPSGPWVLDRFESEPQMLYSSSMREEHVTGTMLTRNSDGSLSVTDLNDLDIGGVRAVSARASDGDLGQRWSFFRNNRLFDAEEQYYDSMQPDPVDVLFSDPNVRAWNGGFTFGETSLSLMLPGETCILDKPNLQNAINTYSNRTFFIRYPFQQEYANIDRVKKINSRVLLGSEVPDFTFSLPDVITLGRSYFNDAVFYATGWTGTPGPNSFSNFQRPGGLSKQGISYASALSITPLASPFEYETNPTRVIKPLADPTIDENDVNVYLSRFMGCFGDGFLRMQQYFFNRTLGAFFGFRSDVRGLIYRGTKHGLINPTPLFSSAVFNGTQFGQPRDMMEQRQYTRFSLNDSSLTDAAVEVVFIDRTVLPDINGSRTNNVVTGSATNSSNVSPFATSEHPYDDALADSGLIWDRDTPLPEEALAF